jgi:antitoxin CptB
VTAEAPAIRLKRLRMRSMRRGIREMDLVLSRFAETGLSGLSEAELDLYETLLDENDQDLMAWITGQAPVPPAFAPLLGRIAGGYPGT